MYVKRNTEGAITAVSLELDGEVKELIDDDSPELAKFFENIKPAAHQLLERSDLQMARVMEDMVNLLIDKNIIQFTELPLAAQEKLLSRKDVRGQMQGVDLLDDEDVLGPL